MPGIVPLCLSISPSASDSGLEISSASPTTDLVESPKFPVRRPYVVAVEGNIGSGKSTLMQYFKDSEMAETVPEPIGKWTNLNGHNALGKMYEDPKRWSFSFNTFATLTRSQMHETITDKPVVLLERSLYSMRYVFIEESFRSGNLHGMEYEVLSKWFNYLVDREHLPIDLFVYLRADPSKCYERLRKRDRQEEVCVPYSLIERLHDYHENWLIHEVSPLPAPVLILDANVEMPEMQCIYDQHRSKILFGHT